MKPLPAIVPYCLCCKCCNGDSGIYGAVDFNKTCDGGKKYPALPDSGIPIHYHRCRSCGLIFTAAFDHFTKEDFLTHIYNDEYFAIDPDYAEARPAGTAAMVRKTFGKTPKIRLLDYGGGNGSAAGRLREDGFVHARTYDPFVPAFAERPAEKFQLITCIEVVEHSPTPLATFRDMASLLAPDGLILLSTLTQPANIEQIGLNWWYAAPRNGHLTLYSTRSLQRVAASLRMTYGRVHSGLHVLFRQALPDFARHLGPGRR